MRTQNCGSQFDTQRAGCQITTCITLEGGKVWRAAKITNLSAGATMEALMAREGKEANTIAKMEQMLTGESFLLNNRDQYSELPPAGQAQQQITEQPVE